MLLEANNLLKERYLLIKKIGIGGFSEVWLAYDQTMNDKKVALKIYAPQAGLSDAGLKMFQKEYEVNSSLPSHLNILRTLYFDILEHKPFLILPYCEKGSLLKELEEENLKGNIGFSEEKIIASLQSIFSCQRRCTNRCGTIGNAISGPLFIHHINHYTA